MINIAIHESKHSEKVVKFIEVNQLNKYCTKRYAKKIIKAKKEGLLGGIYFTKSGKIRATINK